MKKGLIMEGGAMLGMFTCGVIDTLMENDINFDGAIGISAGAVFGCNIKSKQIGRAIRYNKKYCNDPRYCSFRNLIKTGNLYGEEFCYHEVAEILDPFDHDAFENNPMEFIVGATDIKTGKCVYHKCVDGREHDLKWMQASASMPIAAKPVDVDGYLLLDGGIADSIPFEYMESLGYDRNLIILTKPVGYRRKKGFESYLAKFALHKYPAAAKGMFERSIMYNRQMEELEKRERQKTSFVIRPPYALGISRTESDTNELERVYRIGVQEAERRLDELKEFLDMVPVTVNKL